MTLSFQILRPDDLVVLEVEAQNLRLDAKDPKQPMLVVDQASAPAYLVVTFPPQSITERAYFETAPNVPQEPAFNQVPGTTPALPVGTEHLDPPGQVPVRMAGPSRLVFQLPKGLKRLPYQAAALLDWSRLELVVSATAKGESISPPLLPPGALETALELPYRLRLSPGTGVAWVNALRPVVRAGRAELWHTRLARVVKVAGKAALQEASLRKTVPLRAIWSPDFVDHGPLPSHALDHTPFLAALSARDRAQLVILTSGSLGYYVAEDQGTGQWKPSPIHASRLFLSALGGWLSSAGRWSPLPYYFEALPHLPVVAPRPLGIGEVPAAAPAAKARAAARPMMFLPPRMALDLGEWLHLATQGRDHYVKVVYEGYLYPFGHRASLVKVTERKFVPPGDPAAPANPYSVTAYMRQHMYVVVREPDLSYTAAPYTYQGREMPFRNGIRINTVVTPNIDQPVYLTGDQNSFWVQVNGANFQFHLTGTDLAGARVDFLAPLMFVSVAESDIGAVAPGTSDAGSVKSLYVAGGLGPPCVVKGKKVAFADPAAGDTVLKTTALYFDAQVLQSSAPFTAAPFLPTLAQAAVAVHSLEELLGVSSAVNIAYYPPYLSGNLDSNAGVFAELVGTGPGVGFSADRAGGFATPNLVLTALSARKGLVAGSADDAAQGYINPTAFFGGVQVQAMLFGTIPLGSLIPTTLIAGAGKASADKNAPEIRTQAKPNAHQPTQFITKVNWSPELADYEVDPVKIAFNSNGQTSKLALQATITRDLTGAPPQSIVKGELSNFMITLLGVIGLRIDAIKFNSVNGGKTNVTLQLAKQKAIGFIGPLSFLQTLADILPPGLFGGSGPAIDLTSTAIKVRYTLGLPPISIGVFSLENISIMAGVDLPYLNGQPAVEFAFASRSRPFLLTVECLGGGGFVHLVLNTSGIQMVEGALEFGGMFSLDLGVASGGVQIMAGIYFQLAGTKSTLTGFVDISGEVSVLGIVSISVDLNLSLSWIHSSSGDKIQGRATLTVSISVLFFSFSVSLSVERSFGSGKGDPRMAQVMDANDWADYALAFAG